MNSLSLESALLYCVGVAPLAAFVFATANLSFHNCGTREFSADEVSVAGLSLGISPTHGQLTPGWSGARRGVR